MSTPPPGLPRCKEYFEDVYRLFTRGCRSCRHPIVILNILNRHLRQISDGVDDQIEDKISAASNCLGECLQIHGSDQLHQLDRRQSHPTTACVVKYIRILQDDKNRIIDILVVVDERVGLFG